MPDLDRWRATADEAARRDQQLRRAMEIARIGTWEWEVGANRVFWSEELYRIYGLSLEQFAGTIEAFSAQLHPEDREASLAVVRHALATGEPFDFRERIIRPDGEVRVLHSQGEVVRDADGKAVRLFGVCQDVTEQTVAEQRARRAGAEAETERVLHAMATLLPVCEAARAVAREVVVEAPTAREAKRGEELVRFIDRARETLLDLTGGTAVTPGADRGTVK
jgi:PAS domain S-box-containing protein